MAMSKPLLLGLAAAAAAVGYVVLSEGESKADSSKALPSGPSGGGMPPALKTAYDDLLANGKDPAALEKVADELEKYGFKTEADALRAKAAGLRKASPAPLPAPPAPLPTPPPLPIPPPIPNVTPNESYTVTVQGTNVNVRTGPGTNYPVITTANTGDKFTLPHADSYAPPTAGAPAGWSGVILSSGKTGWIAAQYLTMVAGAVAGPAITPSSSSASTAPSSASQPTQAAVYTATVTAPNGLNTRTQPNENAPLVSPNDAYAGTKVTVLQTGLPATTAAPKGWTKIVTPGGATGYASTAYLSFDSPSPPTVSGTPIFSGNGSVRMATMLAPSGARLRLQPSAKSKHRTVVPYGAKVRVIAALPGPKADHQSPGPGGWSRVVYNGTLEGWVPSEWLTIS